MKSSLINHIIVALLLGGSARSVAAQTVWWKDEKVVRELGLSPEQSGRIDAVFRANFPQLSQSKEELDRQEDELSRLITSNADDGQVNRQIDKVESVRASLNKTRTLMLLNMVRVMTPEQRDKFNPIHEQWLRDHPRPPRTMPKPRPESHP